MSCLDFYGNVAFSLNRTFQEHMELTVNRYQIKNGHRYRYQIPVVCDPAKAGTKIFAAREARALPHLIASIGFEEIFTRVFTERFINRGVFRFRSEAPIHKDFQASGFTDPEGIYFIHAVTPYVFLIDREKLADRPTPRTWADLLSPQYRKSIMLNGSLCDIPYIVPLYIFKNFGEKGLTAFAKNVTHAQHAATIAKCAGDGKTEGASISILPWLFAASCPRAETTEVIWPHDGAVTSPMILLQKESAFYQTAPLAKAITGKIFAEKSASAFFPSANAAVNNALPPGASLQWIGWDYLREHPIDILKTQTQEIFRRAVGK